LGYSGGDWRSVPRRSATRRDQQHDPHQYRQRPVFWCFKHSCSFL